ncbi:MAG: hypothetical protein FWH52_01425 [Synergistaceae bacterium]|nr:hypothetical protein [Synergistaceae bacterium]
MIKKYGWLKILLIAQSFVLLFNLVSCDDDNNYNQRGEKMTDSNMITETEKPVVVASITNKEFNELALEYLREKYGEEFQLSDERLRTGKSSEYKEEWENQKTVDYTVLYCSVNQPKYEFYVHFAAPGFNLRPRDGRNYALMTQKLEDELSELTKGFWDEYTLDCAFRNYYGSYYLHKDLEEEAEFFDLLDIEYPSDATVTQFMNDYPTRAVIMLYIKGNAGRSIDRDSEREKIQVIVDEIFEKNYRGQFGVYYMFPDTYEQFFTEGKGVGTIWDAIGVYEHVMINTQFIGDGEEMKLPNASRIIDDNGNEVFGFSMYENRLNDFLSFLITNYDMPSKGAENCEFLVEEMPAKLLDTYLDSDYELISGPFTFSGSAVESYILVDVEQLGVSADDILIVKREGGWEDSWIVDHIVPTIFRVLPDGKIMFYHQLDFAIAKKGSR